MWKHRLSQMSIDRAEDHGKSSTANPIFRTCFEGLSRIQLRELERRARIGMSVSVVVSGRKDCRRFQRRI